MTDLIHTQDISSESTRALGMPGRNVCNFLLFCNLAMWIIDTFELQNGNSGAVEAEIFGVESWVVIQRLTCPLIIFFRFHAFVLCIELDKEYTGKQNVDSKDSHF